MSSNMQRIQSTPAFTHGPAPAAFPKPGRPAIRRIKTSVDFMVNAPSPSSRRPSAVSARADGEDAFSLGGFFPSPSRANDEFEWVRFGVAEEEEEEEEEEGELEPMEEEAIGGGQVLFGQEDTVTAAVVGNEDKLGVLSLRRIRKWFFCSGLCGRGGSANTNAVDSLSGGGKEDEDSERLYSPYAEEAACNEESLHLAFGARRAAQRVEKDMDANSALGELFLAEDGGWKEGWGISTALQSLAGVF
ncbi:hypothetical protein OF83DRAFT_602224 [Amylostereum chailletii]|nr:hypothetical protein OF83DRAFT_602224 [Amylostereum chailletii]